MQEAQFNKAADSYDDDFTHSSIGVAQRKRVYHWLKKSGFVAKSRSIFEINCGTGVDAQYFADLGKQVTATDISSEMIRVAEEKRSGAIDFHQLDVLQIHTEDIGGKALFSNFGGLNCLSHEELRNVLHTIGIKQKQGDYLAVVIMPKYCLVEDLHFLFTFRWNRMFRRDKHTATPVEVAGEQVLTYYHSPKEVKKMLPEYFIELVRPVAITLPPSYLQKWFSKFPFMLRFLNFLEKILGNVAFLSNLSDHYILIASKR